MATRMIEVVTDDITNKEDPSVRNVRFAFDGVDYEIDLNDKNYAKLEDALGSFIEHARVVSKPKVAKVAKQVKQVKVAVASANGNRKPAKMDKAQRQAVREWAVKSGLKVAGNGKISEAVVEAFTAAGGKVVKAEAGPEPVPSTPLTAVPDVKAPVLKFEAPKQRLKKVAAAKR